VRPSRALASQVADLPAYAVGRQPPWPAGRCLPDAGRRACRAGGRTAYDRTLCRPAQAITLGADKAYNAKDFINVLRSMKVTQHVAQNTNARRPAIAHHGSAGSINPSERSGVWRPLTRVGVEGDRLPQRYQETIGGDKRLAWWWKPPPSAFVMARSQFLLEFLIVSLDPPTQLGGVDQLDDRSIDRQVGSQYLLGSTSP